MLVSNQCFPPSRRAAASRMGSFAKYWSRLTTVSVISPQHGLAENGYGRIRFPLTTRRLDFLRLTYLSPRLLRLARSLRPDIVFVSFPLAWQLFEGYLLSRRLKCPLVVDIRDLPVAMFSFSEDSLPRRIFNTCMRSIAHYVSRKGSRITTVTDWLRQELIKALNYPPSRISVIRNGSETELFAKALKVKKEFDVVYSGVINSPIRDPGVILRYLSHLADLLPSLRILLISYISPGFAKRFSKEIERLGLVDKLVFEEMGPPEESPERLGRARLGFNSLIPRCETCIGAIGAKEYEYLAAGLPVVGLMDPEYYIESGRLIVGNKVGILHQDPKRLAAETAALLKDPARLRRMSKRARKVGERFDRKRLAEDYYYKVILPAWQEFNAKG
ncbi:hypothetical protein ES703_00981 [subsurface metagenome]